MRKYALLVACVSMLLGAAPPLADGAHDFDFNLGTWHTHIRRLVHPFSGSTASETYDGTFTVRPVWGGAANVAELEADGPRHLEFLNVRLYNTTSHQWSVTGASSDDGTLESPMFGGFEHGRGVFYDQETYNGRIVLNRQTYSDITPTSYSFEQAYSDDGGTTWQPNFTAHLTRESKGATSERSQTVKNTSHDFDFSYGTWSTRIMSYDGGAPTPYAGTVTWRKVWGGRAFLEELKASNKTDGFEGLTLFLYNPRARQWSQTFAGRGGNTFDPSMIGVFRDGKGVLVGFPVSEKGTMIFNREIWSEIRPNSHQFEIQASRDGGKTWKRTFLADLTRVGPGL